MAENNKKSNSSDSDVDLAADLRALKEDILAVKDDLAKMASSAVEQGREAAGAAKEQARDQLDKGVDATRDYVKRQPLTSLAVAAGVGVLAGLLLNKD